ncbi:two component transcriptional regulator, LuxR family [Clostridium collagenovorans DSM 3089]|uniref:Two component transcriptional regulator, LuxR family n=1 Tax=Clostridium collagenovorans DSM 3089 TaxID=1121306 RepID=A0A1M5YA36_9CLOT|nr:response regulator transcription factor [Clostridium collagenovorans]SHI08951.1 two component transcriptional regulator, LuxR family [Clostridium collagenovorans DSM 3089]
MNSIIISDSFIIRDALTNLLKTNFKVDSITSYLNLKEVSNESLQKTKLLIVDLKMVTTSDMSYLNSLKLKFHNLKVVILDLLSNSNTLSRVSTLNIDAYIINITDKDEFSLIIKKVLKNEKYFDSELMGMLIKSNKRSLNKSLLTKRELEIVSQVSKGFDNKEIAENLYISEYTVKKHISNILSKLHFKNRRDLMLYALDDK